MFVLYHFHQDYDGGECEVLATSTSKEKLEKKRDELMAPSRAYAKAFKEYEAAAKKGIREFCEKHRAALKADRTKHYPSDDEERTAKTIKWNEHKEDKKIKDTVESYYFFTGNEAHLGSLYQYHFDKDKLNEPIPVFIQPQPPQRGFYEGCMYIEEVEEV
jgi:hypothetical protein